MRGNKSNRLLALIPSRLLPNGIGICRGWLFPRPLPASSKGLQTTPTQAIPSFLLSLVLSFLLLLSACSVEVDHEDSNAENSVEITGERLTWHRITLSFEGPVTSELADPNPFTDYRLNVTFRNGANEVVVPGFFAADGDAANTSAEAGNVWQARFTPDSEGEWTYSASFRTGKDVAIADNPDAGSPTAFDGASGSFVVEKTDKTGRDFRAHGRLEYVGEHYLRFAGSGEYFLKGGADSPENFLAYDEIDGTYDADAGSGSYEHIGAVIHTYEPHIQDWKPGDPTWGEDRGKGIIGALNYLASKGMNSVYFLTYNLDGGDGRDTWMWTDLEERYRFDVSKLAQWEIIFSHMDQLGLMMHVITQEAENDRNLGGSGELNPVRKLYYRELVARFAHHPAIVWNLGEENNNTDADRKAFAEYIRDLDPYDHPITVHTHNDRASFFYDALLGDPNFEASSIQGMMANYNNDAFAMRMRTERAGRKWVIFGDEQSPASMGVIPDADDPTHDLPRKQALWGNLMGGGAGVEWYFGHQYPHMDINCEDWRSRDVMWDQTRYALEFFHNHLPFWEMHPNNGLAFTYGSLVLAKPEEIYAVYQPFGGEAKLNLYGNESSYSVQWYNPRSGGELQTGQVTTVTGPGIVSLGQPPEDVHEDWAVLVTRVD
jgi:hypothetical protein